MRLPLTTIAAILLVALAAHAAVDVSLSGPQVTKTDGEQRLISTATFGNEVTSYTLVYDRTIRDDKPGEATSNWWGWSVGFIPIGMTQPSQVNWYWQAFINWTFDDESLHQRPAQVRVVRSGQDGVVEFAWDTPKVKASLFFALPTGSDKLLVFGQYEPKAPVKTSKLTLICYPTGFGAPHNRAITTALGTQENTGTKTLDPTKERWVLYEDVTPDRPGSGSAGLLIGTPDAFASITTPTGGYGLTTTATLKPEARRFALGLYDFPSLPDCQQTRDYFKRSADAEAAAIGQMAAAGITQPLPALPLEAGRKALIHAGQEKLFQRPAELWRPLKDVSFPWVGKQPGGPLKVALFVPRWQAWETMVLAGGTDLQVQHLYFDGSAGLSLPDYWPYAATTGIGSLPYGVAMQRAVQMAQDPAVDVFMVDRVTAAAMPSIARQEIIKQVQAGKGLLLVSSGDWPQELFQTKNDALAAQTLADLAWDEVPGFREGDRGRSGPLVQAYDYGKGHVIVLNVRTTSYGAIVPAHDEVDWRQGVMGTAMAVATRALQAAANRLPQVKLQIAYEAQGTLLVRPDPAPANGKAYLHMVNDQDEPVAADGLLDTWTPLVDGQIKARLPQPRNRAHVIFATIADAAGNTVAYGSAHVPPDPQFFPSVEAVQFAPLAKMPEGALTPQVALPQGGALTVNVQIRNAPAGATVRGAVDDAFGRVLAITGPVALQNGKATLALKLTRPVTVCHALRLTVWNQRNLLAEEQRRFTVALPYPYDDFTGLLWSYAGGDPVLRQTDRLCYEWGADMMDLCHMGGYAEAKAAREYQLAAESGLRVIPYVTRLAGTGNDKHERVPCLHDPEYLDRTNQGLVGSCTQAEPFSPAAYTLGDENYLFNGRNEVCHSPQTVAAFQKWLQAKYGTIAALNVAWAGWKPALQGQSGVPAQPAGTPPYATFADIKTPMLIEEAAKQEVSFAPWLDHKRFMSEAFAATHDLFRDTIRTVDTGAKVGYDGFLGFNWQSGYDFERLGQNLDLNQTYTSSWIQGELMRAFKRPDALTGKWGNSDADVESGWHAFPWHCLLDDDNSVWWWTSFGCDYIPFNPDLSQSLMGKWFFEALRETTSGPGRLLLHADRELSPVAVLHSQTDFHTTDILYEAGMRAPFAAGGQYLSEETAMLYGLRDAGYQYRHLTPALLTKENLDPAKCKACFMPYASCLSDEQIALLQDYVQRGGTLVADGRIGMLTGDGKLRADRPLDALFGVKSEGGLAAFKRDSASGKVAISGTIPGAAAPLQIEAFDTTLLEPGLRVTTGTALGQSGETPALIVNPVGSGRAVLLNMPLTAINTDRTRPGLQPLEQIVGAIVQSAGLQPPATITAADGQPPLCLNTVSYREGGLRYLAIMQDFRVRGLPEQSLHVKLPAPAYVYDVRTGKMLFKGLGQEWDVKLGRGYPLVYALLPYTVTALKPQAPATAQRGEEIAVKVAVQTSAPAGHHVVRLDVFAPGQTTPHRQYSQNLACPKGLGSATIPLARSDAPGQWRLVWRDVATGVTAEGKVEVK